MRHPADDVLLGPAPAPGPREIAARYADDGPPDAFAFARDLEAFRAAVDSLCHNYDQRGPAVRPVGEAVIVLLAALESGLDAAASITCAARALRAAREREAEYQEQAGIRRQADYEALMTEEALTRDAECPTCGAERGRKCRTSGSTHQVRTRSHKARWRLARSLNDGSQEQP